MWQIHEFFSLTYERSRERMSSGKEIAGIDDVSDEAQD